MKGYYSGLWIFVAALLIVTAASSLSPAPSSPTEQIKPVVERAKAILEDPKISGVKKQKLLRELFLPEIDTGEMAQRVLARHWEKYKDRKEEFIAAFAYFFERRFSEKMEMLKGAEAIYEQEKIEGEYAEIQIRLVTSSYGNFSVKLKMKSDRKVWKIYDVYALGKSAVGIYRDQVNALLSSGAAFDELLDKLREGELKGRDRSWR